MYLYNVRCFTIVLVLNITDKFFQYILKRDKAGCAPVLIGENYHVSFLLQYGGQYLFKCRGLG